MGRSYGDCVRLLSAVALVKAVDSAQKADKLIKKLAKKGENTLTLGVMGNSVENEELKYNKKVKPEKKL